MHNFLKSKMKLHKEIKKLQKYQMSKCYYKFK